MNTSDVLDRAADLIEEHGWGVGADTWTAAAEEGLCIEGALGAVLGLDMDGAWPASDEVNKCAAGQAVREYLGLADQSWFLWRWNDEKGRTQEQVVSVLRAAALIERAKENTEVREAAHV